MKKILISLIIIAALLIGACTHTTQNNINNTNNNSTNNDSNNNTNNITDFLSCVEAGNPVMESYPRQCSYNNQSYTEKLSPQETCENLFNGQWIESAKECEGISQNACEEQGGKFFECGSACRNNPEAEFCTMQCVQYCSFKNDSIVGADKDEYGCIGSAGYSWDSNKQECVRAWEENQNSMQDSYGNTIPQNCTNWFDGCNNCMITPETGEMGCTKMFCQELTPAYCLKTN